jgi:hypothetical protein
MKTYDFKIKLYREHRRLEQNYFALLQLFGEGFRSVIGARDKLNRHRQTMQSAGSYYRLTCYNEDGDVLTYKGIIWKAKPLKRFKPTIKAFLRKAGLNTYTNIGMELLKF